MRLPCLIINLKNYRKASGQSVLEFLKYASEYSGSRWIYVAPPVLDLYYVSSIHSGEYIFSQHVDRVEYGSSTGHIPLERLIDMGIAGSLINHSEFKVDAEIIGDIVSAIDGRDFDIVVCIDSLNELRLLLGREIYPSAYAIEPPELIGTGRSVSKYKPEVIREAYSILKDYGIPLICGAGISSWEDVSAARRLGAVGVLVASAVVKSREPGSVIKRMSGAL